MNFKITTRELDELCEKRDECFSELEWFDKLESRSADHGWYEQRRESIAAKLQNAREALDDAISAMRTDVEEALAAVNSRAESFTVTSFLDVIDVARHAERHMDDAGIPQALRRGTAVHYRPAGPSANAYKYAAASTGLTLKRVTDGWRLIDIRKTKVYPKQAERLDITISPEARDAVIRSAMNPFTVADSLPSQTTQQKFKITWDET